MTATAAVEHRRRLPPAAKRLAGAGERHDEHEVLPVEHSFATRDQTRDLMRGEKTELEGLHQTDHGNVVRPNDWADGRAENGQQLRSGGLRAG